MNNYQNKASGFIALFRSIRDHWLWPRNRELTRLEAKALLGISSDTTLISWEKLGKIQPRKVGKKVMYLESELKSLLNTRQL